MNYIAVIIRWWFKFIVDAITKTTKENSFILHTWYISTIKILSDDEHFESEVHESQQPNIEGDDVMPLHYEKYLCE